MKTTFKSIVLLVALVSVFVFTSCDDNEPDTSVTVNLVNTKLEYDAQGVWSGYLNPENGAIDCQGVSFSHKATVSQWGTFWEGFCPSRSADTEDYSSGNWIDHMWGTMAAGGVGGKGTPFLVAYWNTMEGGEPGDAASLQIKCTGDLTFEAKSVYVNNSTYAYYVMKNGSPFSKKFGKGDWMKVMFYGVTEKGAVTAPVEYYLADYRSETESEWEMTTGWTMVNLESLNAAGRLKSIYIQMASSDSGQFGMNTPAVFSMDRLQIRL